MTDLKNTNKKLMIIGGISYPGRVDTLGGTTIAMENFLQYCQQNEIPFVHISTNVKGGRLAFLLNFLYLIRHFLRNLSCCETIMFNAGGRNGAFFTYPVLAVLGKMFRKKTVFRMFGGNFVQLHQKESFFGRLLFKLGMNKTDLICAETQVIVDFLKELTHGRKKAIWFPNVRQKENSVVEHTYRKKFVFISRVTESKGVDIIMQAMKNLPADFRCDFYGPTNEARYTKEYFATEKTAYHGQLAASEVQSTLARYDVLLLPTFWRGEGYPGIIIEAMAQGIPIIASTFGGIPEIVQSDYNGFLIPPHSVEALEEAMLKLDTENYQQFSKNSQTAFEEKFESNSVNNRIVNAMSDLCSE